MNRTHMKIFCKCGNSKKADLNGLNVPKNAVRIACNICPKCEDDSNDDCYEEWFEDEDGKECYSN